ncbi:MAG TPA: penicillin acylase family protein [Spirochaetota bacterium]|nr:penicillin acylase family protein [Spirochaetota bacterium]
MEKGAARALNTATGHQRMTRKKKALYTAVIAAGALALLSACATLYTLYIKTPDLSRGVIPLAGARGDIIIRRDALGVPFVEAADEGDLFFGAGFAAAADRMWQMEVMRMAGRGRLSEFTGADSLPLDRFLRALDIQASIGSALASIDPHSLHILESYARGVTAFIETQKLPAEFSLTGHRPAPWTPEDSLYVFAMLNLGISYNFCEELNFLLLARRVGYDRAAWLVPVYHDETLPFAEAEKLAQLPHEKLIAAATAGPVTAGMLARVLPKNAAASNNWAMSGRRTRSGRSIVANDTHLVLSIPNSWMMMHLRCPGYDAAGVAVPGVPLVTLGFNGRVAWGATMVMADSQDVFLEKMRTMDGKREYLYRGRWHPVTERKELIRIKGEKPVEVVLGRTRHGVLIDEALANIPFEVAAPMQPIRLPGGYALALRWPIEDSAETFRGFYLLGRARSAGEAREALRKIKSVYLNIVYGDADTIAWQVTGKYPVRKKGTGMLPSPGWNGEYDWTGWVPFEMHPHAVNPREGYVATANQRIVPRGHPLHLSASWYSPARAGRIREFLDGVRGATREHSLAMQMDTLSPTSRSLQEMLGPGGTLRAGLEAVIGSWSDGRMAERAREAMAMLDPSAFDAVLSTGSAPAAVYGAFLHCFTRNTFLDELGPDDGPAWEAFLDANRSSYSAMDDHLLHRADSPFFDDIATPEKEVKTDIVAKSLADAILLCEQRLGGNRARWQWGRLHTYTWRHDIAGKVPFLRSLLDRGPFPAPGDASTMNVAGYSTGRDFEALWIPAMRMVVDFGLDEPAVLVAVPGQSGDPSSPHYDDMIGAFLSGENHPLPFRKENVERHYPRVLTIRPAR